MVWMYPMSANLKEATFQQVLQTILQRANLEFFAPWNGFDKVREVISAKYAAGSILMASDFSETDEHFTHYAMSEVFDVIKWCFQEQYWDDLQASLLHVNAIPLLVGKDKIIYGSHGVSSGSNWTNFAETIFDLIFAFYVAAALAVLGIYAIGDDMAWASLEYNDKFGEELEALGKDVGQVINRNKTKNDPDSVVTLQRLFQRGYYVSDSSFTVRGVYPTIRALKSIIYPEKFHNPKLWSSDMMCARTYMILENCVDHPLFEQFVKFVIAGHRDLVPFAKLQKAKLDRILQETKLLPGFNPTYNQEKRDLSLADFASIRIAASV